MLAAAVAWGVPLRLLGGVAVRLRCTGPDREFKDLAQLTDASTDELARARLMLLGIPLQSPGHERVEQG